MGISFGLLGGRLTVLRQLLGPQAAGSPRARPPVTELAVRPEGCVILVLHLIHNTCYDNYIYVISDLCILID